MAASRRPQRRARRPATYGEESPDSELASSALSLKDAADDSSSSNENKFVEDQDEDKWLSLSKVTLASKKRFHQRKLCHDVSAFPDAACFPDACQILRTVC